MYVLAIGLVLSDEIVKLREYRAANSSAEPPKYDDPGFRALVEENVKNTVSRISSDAIMTNVSSSRTFALPPPGVLLALGFDRRSRPLT